MPAGSRLQRRALRTAACAAGRDARAALRGQALARAAGEGGREAEGAEAAALADEADMPIEQLLARYGIARDGGAAPPAAPAPGLGAARRAARGGRPRGAAAGAEADAAPRAEPLDGDSDEVADRPAKRRRAEGDGTGGAPPPAVVPDAADAEPGACCRAVLQRTLA